LMPTIAPGEVFFDRLDDGRYEKCILQKTDGSEPDRMAAARGGTGEFYREIPEDEVRAELLKEEEESSRLDNAQMIWAVGDGQLPKMVFLERIP